MVVAGTSEVWGIAGAWGHSKAPSRSDDIIVSQSRLWLLMECYVVNERGNGDKTAAEFHSKFQRGESGCWLTDPEW